MMAAIVLDELFDGLDVRDGVVAGRHGDIPVRRYTGPAPTSTVVWVHGGAFSGGGLDQLESHAVAAALAQSGATVVTLDYQRVAAWSPFRTVEPAVLPGIRFPIPLDDVTDVFDAVAAASGEVILGGASAGACLTAAATLRAVRSGATSPAGVVLAYGTFHADLPPLSASLEARVRGRHGLVQFRPTTVRRMNYNYAGNTAAMRDPAAFPGGHDLTGFPPTLILDADRDTLRASGERFADELADARVTLTRHIVPGSTHGFLNRPARPAFHEGIRHMASWIATRKASLDDHQA